ncbi:protein LAZY 1-like [Papaver somniferum]|uniref:protein LAZY 1-like n=1 Tax=Papaver somniferum TaxID=3469 RepID=UPI000E7040B9|nr:protein LAZY 1-like [Papaver somniferum]
MTSGAKALTPEQQQYYHPKPNIYTYCYASLFPGQPTSERKSPAEAFARMGSSRVEENNEFLACKGLESSSADVSISGCFDGFLTIEILGLDQNQLVIEPQTPTFSFENVSQNNLKLANEELEKVLNANVINKLKDDRFYWNGSMSARTGHVSTVTLGASTDNGSGDRKHTPLQGYFDLPTECTIVARKNPRPSLGELFQKNRLEKENYSKENYHTKYSAGVSDMSIKKFLKWLMLRSGTPADPVSAENRLQKALQIFSRKVHPECSTVPQNSQMSRKNENNTGITLSYNKNAARSMVDEEISSFPPRSHQTQKRGTMTKDSTLYANGEYWIKTDAEYLVLEL